MSTMVKYCVINYVSDQIVFTGHSEAACADKLEPGHVYGKASCIDDAIDQARQRAYSARKAMGVAQ